MIKKIKSQIIPINRKDIDTDLIIPANFLTCTNKTGLGKHLFSRLRKVEKDFPLNVSKYKNSAILVSQENFGCGSSREHASWALSDYGIKVIIAPSYSDIFFNNAMKNMILPIVADKKTVEKIFNQEAKSKKYKIEIDLPNQSFTLPDKTVYKFTIDPYRKECLIQGIDDMSYLLKNIRVIKSFDTHHRKTLFINTDSI